MIKFKNKKRSLSIFILFLIGLIFGLFFILFLSDLDKTFLKNEISNYISLINNNKIEYFPSFINSLKINITYITFIWIISFIFIFYPLIYTVITYKGFLVGLLLSSFVSLYGIKGIIYGFIFMFPHEIINIILIIMISLITLKQSKKLYLKYKNNENINIRSLFKKQLKIYLAFIILSIISSLLEVFVGTFLVRLII